MIKWKNINWLLVASSFTAAYLIFIVVWIGPHKIIAFSETDQLNAIGDFLAGIFSPLAFIWLVAAVLTQRQELTDTRDQFAENQKVVDAQLKTINEQSELLHQQHALAEDTSKNTYRLSLFEQRFAIYNELVGIHNDVSHSHNLDRHLIAMLNICERSAFVFSADVHKYLDDTVNQWGGYLGFITGHDEAFASDPWGNFSEEPASVDMRAAALKQRTEVVERIYSRKLKEIMWNDMHVSDS